MLLNNTLIGINKRKMLLLLAVSMAVVLSLIISIIVTANKSGKHLDPSKINYVEKNDFVRNSRGSDINDIVSNGKIQENLNTNLTKNYGFSVPELNKKLYAEDFLVAHDSLRKQIVEYCASNVLSTQTSQLNCNSASKVNNVWYMVSWFSSGLIKVALSTPRSFFIAAGVLFLFGLLLQCLWRFGAWFTRAPGVNVSPGQASGSKTNHIIAKYQ